jgi:hypothetical protein
MIARSRAACEARAELSVKSEQGRQGAPVEAPPLRADGDDRVAIRRSLYDSWRYRIGLFGSGGPGPGHDSAPFRARRRKHTVIAGRVRARF